MAFGEVSPSVKNLLSQANLWLNTQTFSKSGLGTTTSSSIILKTATAAASGAQQVSPAMEWEGQSFASGSKRVNFRTYVLPVQGTTNAFGKLITQYSVNAGSYNDLFELGTSSDSDIPYVKSFGRINQSFTNSSTLGTRRSVELDNPSGSQTQIGFSFASSLKSGFTVDSSGYMQFKTIASNGFSYAIGASVDTAALIVQIYGAGIFNAGGSFNNGNVTAGSTTTAGPGKLSIYGSMAWKGVHVTTSTYILNDETLAYCDTSSASVCAGTPTTCNTYVSSGTCNAHSGVGCSWFSGTPCSTYNGTDQSTCQNGHSGCTWEEVSCGGANNTDQSTCESQDDSYGGSCSWDTGTCPSYNSDKTNCQATSGCTWNSSDCHAFDAGDQGTCESHSGCSWVGGNCNSFNNTDASTCTSGHTGCTWEPAVDCHLFDGIDEATCIGNFGCAWNSGDNTCYGICSGLYNEGSVCNGEYDTSCTGNLCTGNYFTGNCAGGSWGAECQGTAACSNLTDDGMSACNAESGCTWTSGIDLTFPSISSVSNGTIARLYGAKKINSGSGNLVLKPTGTDVFEDGSTVTLSTQYASRFYHPFTQTADCGVYNNNSSGCTAQSGCTFNPASCGDFGADEATCNAASGCSWDGDSCEGTYSGSNGSCSGTYVISRKWMKWSGT